MNNIITIDPSQNSTAMVVNGKIFNYANIKHSMNVKGTAYKKWFELCSKQISIRVIDYEESNSFVDTEARKLAKYDEVTDMMLDDIIKSIDPSLDTIFAIEGYSFASASGKLIDLVTLGTILRYKVMKHAHRLIVIPPNSLKLSACKLTYDPVDIGKRKPKFVHMNNEGVKGGSFKKHEIYKSIIENTEIKSEWKDFLVKNSNEILSAKKIPTPIDDVNDAFIMFHIILHKINSGLPLDT